MPPEDVTQESPTKNGVTYDFAAHKVSIKVIDNNGDGTMSTETTVDGSTDAIAHFTNEYAAAAGSQSFKLAKTVTGRDWKDGESFTFDLTANPDQSNVPEDVFPYALLYLRIYLLGMPVILLYNFEAAVFRSIGDTKVPLAALAVSGVLNVLLNLFFVIVLHMTVNGVAIATVAANAVSAALLYVRLTRTDKCVRVERKALRIDGASLKRILSIGLPAGVQSAVFSFANIVIQSAINTLGTVAIAASSAAFNVEILAYDVLNSFSQACTTFVGQNYGAGQIKRCKKTMQLSFLEGAIATFVSVVVLLLSARSLLAIFNSDPEVIAIGYIRLATILPAYVFCLIYEILSGYLRGFGISLAPALLTMLGVCGIRIAWVKFVFPTSMTFQTVMWVYPISLGATAMLILCAVLIYRPSRRFAGLETEEADK